MLTSLTEMPCELVTALLAANFDAASLANRLADVGVRVDARCGNVHLRARNEVLRNPDFGRRLSGQLDRLHAGRRAEVRAAETEMLEAWAVAAKWEECRDFGGVLWAFARDPRAEVRAATRILVQRLIAHALRPESSAARDPLHQDQREGPQSGA